MNTLFLTRLYEPHIGGVEKHVKEVAKRLVKKGHEVSIVTENFSGDLPEFESKDGIKIYRFKPGGKLTVWLWFWRNRRLIEQADVVHAHDVFFWLFPSRFPFPKKPMYVTFHGYEGDVPPKKGAVLVRKLSEKLAQGNICIGDYIAKWYGTKPTFVSYGAVELPRRFTEGKTAENRLIFVGRLDEQTGILTYLETVKELKKNGVKVELEIYGDGKFRPKAEKVGKVHGFVKDPLKPLAQARFALVSRYLSILEAMLFKKLVFAVYDNPLKQDYLKMAPFAKWIVIETSPKKLAEKIKHFLENPQQEKKMVEPAYNWAKKQTWDKVVKLYENLWSKK